MAEMETVKLAAHHQAGWRFRDRSRTLSGDSILLKVRDGNKEWRFECRREGDMYCIKGNVWSRFVRDRIPARLTLYSKEEDEDFHRIRVKQ